MREDAMLSRIYSQSARSAYEAVDRSESEAPALRTPVRHGQAGQRAQLWLAGTTVLLASGATWLVGTRLLEAWQLH
jgi:hypothetical protein